jgi:DNA (cytosine-5)-methyltransferase 1
MPDRINCIELFSGIGGLALGMSRAGFQHALLVERDRHASETIERNKRAGIAHVARWPLMRADIRSIDWSAYRGRVETMSGGPPCQPFAIGGKQRGFADNRDMWPEAARAVAAVAPHAFVFENVRNLAGPTFAEYLEWVKASLRHPDQPRHAGETHAEHLRRLRASGAPPSYMVDHLVVNAADFGAPQLRHRVLVRGVRAGTVDPLAPLLSTHTRDRLLWDQWVTGDYWTRHGLRMPPDRGIPEIHQARVTMFRSRSVPPRGLAWVTARDALAGLGEPNGIENHVHQPGARIYKGHTGSPMDMPAKALKAGDHGVPGGENMMRRDDGSVRYFTVREAARLVGLPDEYAFPSSWSETMRGLGNAVPLALGEAIGRFLSATIAAVGGGQHPGRRRRAA